MKLYIYIFAFLLCTIHSISAQQTPAPKQTEAITIEGATAHLGNGTVIENALIMFDEGKLTFVGSANTKIARRGKIINATGRHVYPGFILPNTTLGIGEIDAVRATIDEDEVGAYNPHIRSIIAYNTESRIVESMRPNGVLIGQIAPRGGVIAGTSSIVQLDAWNWEDAILKEDDGVHLKWPSLFTRGRWWLGEDPALKPNENYNDKVEEIKSFFNKSSTYLNSSNSKTNIIYEAMAGVFNGDKTLFINADHKKAIIDAVNFAKNLNVKRLVIVGAYDAPKVSSLLKQNNVAVLAQRVHLVPNSSDDDYDYPYKLAKLLHEDGVLVGLETSGGMERMNSRNLPFYAGTVAAQGLDKEEALKLITSNTAKILNIDNSLGTLEVGKDATLFISEGDALDMRTNKLEKAYIQGRDISLETHQTELWKRYSKKYDLEK